MATRGPSPSIQRRHIVPRATERPSAVSHGRDCKAQGEGRPSTSGALKMGLEGLSRAKDGRLAIGNRPTHHKQVLPEEVHEDGDPSTPTTHREAGGPLGLVRPQGRVLRPSDTPGRPRGVHNKLKWAAAAALRAAYGLVTKPICISKTNGRVRQQAAGPRGYGDEMQNEQGQEEVDQADHDDKREPGCFLSSTTSPSSPRHSTRPASSRSPRSPSWTIWDCRYTQQRDTTLPYRQENTWA